MYARSLVLVILGGLGLGWVPAASAQAPEEVALDAVRTRSAISADEPAMDNWITFRLKQLREDLQSGAVEADDHFLKAYHAQYLHAENSAAFKVRFAEQTGRRFAAEFEKGQGLEVAVGQALARALADMKDVITLAGLSAGLRANQQPAVRYTCAKVLADLIPTIQTDAALVKRVLELLRTAGEQERNGLVRTRIYQALFYREANLEPAVQALLQIIKRQLQLRESSAPACSGAEEVVFNFLRGEINNLPAKERLVALLAVSLRLDVQRYLSEGLAPDERYLIELSVDAAESLLSRLVSPAGGTPNVRDALKKAQDRDLNLPLELNKWIGTPQTKGMLNGPPWNVAVGAPVPD